MVVYRIYYQMVDRSSKNVSGIWKVLHIWTQAMAAGSGIICVWYFYVILQAFRFNCPLFAKVEFTLLKPGSAGINILPKNITVNLRESVWGADVYCQYTFITWMVSFIGGLLVLTFFFWSKSGGGGGPRDSFVQPWRHVLPTLLVSTCYVVATSVAAYFASSGLDVFCTGFMPYIKATTCNYKIDVFSFPFANRTLQVNHAIIMIRSCAPICVISWICQTAVLFLRICIAPDFDVQIIKIIGIRRTERLQNDEPPEQKGEDFNAIFDEHRDSMPSLHELFAHQPSRPTAVRFSTPDVPSEGPDKSDKKSKDLSLMDSKSSSRLPRPSDFNDNQPDEARMLAQTVISVDSDINLDPRKSLPKALKSSAGIDPEKRNIASSDVDEPPPERSKHSWFSPEGFVPKTSNLYINQGESVEREGSSPEIAVRPRRTTSILKNPSQPSLEELPESPSAELKPKQSPPPVPKDKDEISDAKSLLSPDERDLESAPTQQGATKVYSRVFLNKEGNKAPDPESDEKKEK